MPLLSLLTADGQSAVGRTLSIPASGLVLTLRVAPAPAHHLEPAQTQLTLTAPADETTLVGGNAGLVVVSNLGPLSTGWTAEQAQDVKWLTVDWGTRKLVVALQLDSVVASGATETAIARLKVSEGGAWFPAFPSDTVNLNARQALPALVASRLMLELGTLNATTKVFEPVGRRLKGLTVVFAEQPQDLSLAVGELPPSYRRPGRMLPGQQVVIDQTLLDEALRRAFPRDGSAADIPLTFQDAVQGRLTLSRAQLTARAVHERLDTPPPDSGAALAWEGEAVGQVAIDPGAPLDEVRFTLAPELVPERLLMTPRPGSGFSQAQLCGTSHSAAQGFEALSAPLAGVDLWLRPTTTRVLGTLALHPDEHGAPGAVPFTDAVMPVMLEETSAAPWPSRWVSLQLPTPLRLDAGPWWLVLSLTEGEALWPLEPNAPSLARPVPLHRSGSGSWVPWKAPPAAADRPWTPCRLRATTTTPPATFQVELRRGSVRKTVATDADGRVLLTREQLAVLSTGTPLTLAVTSPTVPVRGSVRFTDLRISVLST